MHRSPDNTSHGIQPKGPGGRYNVVQPQHYSIFKSSKNIDACKDFLRYMIRPENYTHYIQKCEGFYGGVTPKWENHKVFDLPVLSMLPPVARYGRNFGHPGPNDAKAAEVLNKYIITDLYALLARGDSINSVIKWAEKELKNIYYS